ncbi:HdeD family acid-resistance protein [Tropicimonas sp. S265A]|uniref:HdeD family acid-resistance protein n=1 Tax=Tropicimonas sp. S265A TaxID=3415134 RepID=UPI003C7DEE9D
MTDLSSDPRSGAPEPVALEDQSTDYVEDVEKDAPRLNWKWMLAAGIIYVLGAMAALINPFLASLIAQSLIAAAFLISGGIVMWMAFRNEDGTTGGRLLGGFAGLLTIALAVALWANPLAGLISLTLTVASLLIVIGVARIWIGFRMQNRKGTGWMILAGVLSVGLGVYIFATLPEAAFAVLGLYLAAELLFSGAAYIATALAARTSEKAGGQRG